MLQVARLAPKELRDASDRVVEYLREQFNTDGGARDRDGDSDLYYTVFGLDGLTAMRAETPPPTGTHAYLRSFGNGDDLDLVHLSCLARCWAAVEPAATDLRTRKALAENLERFRTPDGGYGPQVNSDRSTVYHCFLAYGAQQDLGGVTNASPDMIDCVMRLQTPDGAFSNERGLTTGSTPATAAAVTLLRNLGVAPPPEAGTWLLQRVAPDGGFLAVPKAPIPDLLSTATALHALSGMQISTESVRAACLDFVDTLWTGRAFCGNWSDDHSDVEYTFYGLLALGHLSLP